MIVYKFWFTQPRGGLGVYERWSGWFLFGIIPIYIKQDTYWDRNK